ncbi:MAG: SDR family NAD(P)-dependent oxidoreductase [Deltaproteobacteria bacterium]|nr:MAG: SDR family NAD(P)-dependent oxidoreductase [Deltaproteobacteria bacterium]
MRVADPGSAVITGASTGIGRATALQLDRKGWRVFAGVRTDRDAKSLRAAASDRLTPLSLDVTRAASIEASAKQVAAAVGGAGLRGLVNNAGISCPGAIEFIELDEVRRQLEVNLVGPIAVTQAFLPLIRRASGRIVNVGSMGGFVSNPFLGAYAASKFALEAVTDSLRRELVPWGIEVSIVQPGSIATEIWRKGRSYSDELLARLPEGAAALYRPYIEALRAYVDGAARRAIPPEAVARAIEHALCARRPRTRYRVGIDAQLMRALTRLLPDRLLDALILRVSGLARAGRSR